MSSDDDLSALITDLVTTLQELETEVEPTTDSGLPRPPTPSELLRFTSDVTIPAVILVLKTNIEALKILRRALRMAEGRPTSTGSASDEVRQRASDLSRATLSRLDGALTDLQQAVEGTPEDEEARELIQEAQQLRGQIQDRLANEPGVSEEVDSDQVTDVPVDVDAELRSIKDDIEGPDRDDTGPEDGEGSDEE
ncbi:hypothetical protein HISP_07810 [Haloarcula hispanica N601]|uniref:Uncharacterized protein n=3 Tax=Haloarcula hispanica TaxID=51589 RepID=A0A482T8U5_HALHI|nr:MULTISPECIES: hypothetical protein [Haloarcula]AEM57136.1 conserved hypothetical protein [Haloarcula hispanica ATCC 33960]AHB65923.1 hypothetical protein HISP_07810 [Haloarcula hispanica N601]KAA9407138.1 hypothetical protein Har1131_10115 [Haloarcula sp. CBA1131]KAA9409824.1 hypothetical protein EGO51_08415 [Haloarcula hispanica]KZX48607.1 hypothetical protein AV929_06500 [Haloarcula sp. K1]